MLTVITAGQRDALPLSKASIWLNRWLEKIITKESCKKVLCARTLINLHNAWDQKTYRFGALAFGIYYINIMRYLGHRNKSKQKMHLYFIYLIHITGSYRTFFVDFVYKSLLMGNLVMPTLKSGWNLECLYFQIRGTKPIFKTMGSWERAQLVKRGKLNSIPITDYVANVCNPGTGEQEREVPYGSLTSQSSLILD